MYKVFFLFLFLANTALVAQEYYYSNKNKVLLTPIESNTSTLQSRSLTDEIRYFETPNKQIVGVTDTLILKTQALQRILAHYEVILVSELSEDLYLLKVKDKAQLFEICNKLYKESEVEFAHPNFHKKVHKR